MSDIKTFVKWIVPTSVLKKCFLVYNTFKIQTIDKVLYRAMLFQPSEYISNRNERPFLHVDLSDLSDPIRKHMEGWRGWFQEDFILHCKRPCIIEPQYGWALIGLNTLIFESLSFSRAYHQRKPSLLNYWLRRNIQKVGDVISLRDTGEENYFHFYNDVLFKLFWLEQNGLKSNSVQVVISQKLWSKPYFQGYYQSSLLLQSIQWIVQENQFIACNSAYFVKAPTHDSGLWKSVLTPFQNLNHTASHKLFITRKRSRLRFIENEAAILEICRNNEIKIIDNDQLSLAEQIEIFSKAGVIVGIHGAGLTNMCFSGPDCRVLEIFPSLELGYLPFHYIMLAKMKRFKYNAVVGQGPTQKYSGGFYLSPEKFSKALEELLL